MTWDEYNECFRILSAKPKLISLSNDSKRKLHCLDLLFQDRSPAHIHAAMAAVSDQDVNVRERAVEVAAFLFERFSSHGERYESVKNLRFDTEDIKLFKQKFERHQLVSLLSIATLSGNGYVRQEALIALAATESPKAIHFLILRLGDWVKNVRETAFEELQKFMTDENRFVFISELLTIEALLDIKRVEVAQQYKAIISFITEMKVDNSLYDQLNDKVRLIYARKCIEHHGVDDELITRLLYDSNFLIRSEAIKYLPTDSALVPVVLNDRASHVRVKMLYHIQNTSDYREHVMNMTSDTSTSVRDLARFILKSQQVNFRDVYQKRINANERMCGSIAGLGDVGTPDDVELILRFLNIGNANITSACITAIYKLDKARAKFIALEFLKGSSNRVKRRCIEILASMFDQDVLAETERIYDASDITLKKMILGLFARVGGWDVLSLLIRAVSDSDEALRNMAWICLNDWNRTGASRLFSTPPKASMDKSIDAYNNSKPRSMSAYQQRVWNETKHFLRCD